MVGRKWRSVVRQFSRQSINIMHSIRSPQKAAQFKSLAPSVKISPIKVPPGAKQIGNYILGKTIGNGSYGKVHLGLHIPTGERVAVKIIQKLKLTTKDSERVHREINILSRIMHSCLIQLYQIIETEKSLLFITEYMPSGELFNHILQNKKLPETQACRIFQQLIDGVEYLHQIGIAHRDLKPENILIDFDGRIKIIDFGLSNTYLPNQKLKTECGSPCYAAPEMIEGKHRYDPVMIDIWSSGIVLFAMICGYLPFCDPETAKLYKKILAGNFKFPAGISEDAQDLITSMLRVNPSKRATLKEIKQHRWFSLVKYEKSPGIDPRYVRVPVESEILNRIQGSGHKIGQIDEQVQLNKKNKETAFYYIMAKKLVKEGCPIPSFIGSPDFDESLVKPLNLSEEDNQESTGDQVVCQAPIIPEQPIEVFQGPDSGAIPPDTYKTLKSPEFKTILKQFLAEEKMKDILYPYKKEMFYQNLNNQKKKNSLKLDPEPQKRALTLIAGDRRRAEAKTTLSSVCKVHMGQKSILDMIQIMKTGTNTVGVKTAEKLRKKKKPLLPPIRLIQSGDLPSQFVG